MISGEEDPWMCEIVNAFAEPDGNFYYLFRFEEDQGDFFMNANDIQWIKRVEPVGEKPIRPVIEIRNRQKPRLQIIK